MAWKPTYASLDAMREWLRVNDPSNTDDDAITRRKLSAASRAVDGSCKRQFGKVDAPVTRSYELRWSRTLCAWWADIDDVMDTTGLAFSIDGGATLDPSVYTLHERNALADGKPYTYIVLSSSVSWSGDGILAGLGLWGWNQTGWHVDAIEEATMLQASRLSIRRDSPYGIAGGSDSGSEVRLLERLDPDIAPIVRDLVRTGWVAR